MGFVGLVEFVESPQRIALPALVRLGCVDCFYDLLPNALYVSGAKGLVLRESGGNRIVHEVLRRRALASIEHELVGDVVERASEILDYIGGNGCQVVGHGVRFGDVVDALSGLRVFLASSSIRCGLIEGVQPKLKVLDVFVWPV
jgi:hypothetical protein